MRQRQERDAAEAKARAERAAQDELDRAAELKERQEQDAMEAAAREEQRKADELLGGRAMLETFVQRYGQIDEFKSIAEIIGAHLNGNKKSLMKRVRAQVAA